MTKIYELEYELREMLDSAMFDLDYANEHKTYMTLREALYYGFNWVNIKETDGKRKSGYREEDFTDEDLERKVAYCGLGYDADGYDVLELEFVNADELCDN